MKRFSSYVVVCLALLFCVVSAERINGKSPDVNSGYIDVTASPYLANGSDTNDDTDEIQAAIDALKYTSTTGVSGGILHFPKGIYRVGNPDANAATWTGFSIPAGVIVEGVSSTYNGMCQILLTPNTSGNAKAIFTIEGNRERIVIRDLTLVGPQQAPSVSSPVATGTVAIRAQGASGQFAFGARFMNLTIMRFNKAIVFNENPPTDHNWQYTLIKLDHVNIWECNTGVYINTINTDWEITSSLIGVYKDGIGVDIVRSGFVSIKDSQGGGGEAGTSQPPGGTLAADTFIWIRGSSGSSHGNINLQTLQSEGFRSALKIDLQDLWYPITLINCSFGDLVQIRANCIFVSTGSSYRANTVRTVPPMTSPPEDYPGASHALLYSTGDFFVPFDNQNRNCATNSAAECPLDFIINNSNGTGTPHNNALIMRAGEKRVDVGRPARFTQPVGIGNVDAPQQGINGASNTVLLNLATDNSSVIPLRIGGSAFDSNGAEGCPACYYEIRRQMTYASPDDGTIGFLSFTGLQSGYTGFKFNGSVVPSSNGAGDLGSSGLKWNKLWAINTVIGDAILSDKKTGQELYRIYEDVNNIFFEDIRTGKQMMRLDRDGNLHLAGRIIEGTARPARKNQTRTRSRSKRRRS